MSRSPLPSVPASRATTKLRTLSISIALLLGTPLVPFAANAAGAFPSCDGNAYLTQGQLSRTYALDLQSGDYKVASSYHSNQTEPPYAWTKKASLNALGFNPNDGFVYGWSKFHEKLVRVHNDWSVEPLESTLNGKNKHFYVGDVSATENRYYAYARGGKLGLYSVELDPGHSDYLKAKQIISGSKLSLNLYDFAVHPSNGMIYGVESNGKVIQIDPNTGSKTILGDAKVYGTFGAAFFDDDGNLHIARNRDGKVFRIGIDSGNYLGEQVAKVPGSTVHDGFRCVKALSTGQGEAIADFGDAPDSYNTSLKSDGARHLVAHSSGLRLGAAVDVETDAYAFPLADSDDGADEDGAKFITRLIERQTGRMAVDSSDNGFLNVWVDVDRNGRFEASDQLVTDRAVSSGSNMVLVPVPDNVNAGDTWARVRLSSEQGLESHGLAPDGEVEDYLVSVQDDPMTVSTYPSKNSWSTVAFEDNWPFVGDYDMNDLVTRLRTRTYKDSTGYKRVDIEGYVKAAGAFYRNGFAIRLPGVPRSAIDEANLEFSLSDVDETTSPLEPGRREAIFVITDDVYKHVSSGNECTYYRTEPDCGADLEFKFSLSIPFLESQSAELKGVFDPFLFATPDAFHGAHFVTPPGRSYEVHLKNQAPTEAFDPALFAGVGQDKSDPAQGLYFQTGTGMPWALEIGADWRYPYEYTELSVAYPDFPAFATSGGQENKDWFLESNAVPELIFPE